MSASRTRKARRVAAKKSPVSRVHAAIAKRVEVTARLAGISPRLAWALECLDGLERTTNALVKLVPPENESAVIEHLAALTETMGAIHALKIEFVPANAAPITSDDATPDSAGGVE